jgi:hypothetical protein
MIEVGELAYVRSMSLRLKLPFGRVLPFQRGAVFF